ncbi:MAG TPA: DNA-3-methyladenine glycosylase [Steroidobacteraceae bacterium]|nr:DNA-3-methyladenine glycosylase [Steroidobacteraceae bacterium]
MIGSHPDAPASLRPPLPRLLTRAELPRDTIALARFLLGKIVVRRLEGGLATGRIVETEAYLDGDPACHAYRGMTPRNRSLFLDVGHAYVYRCYGTCWMLNVSSEAPGTGAGVLLRALEPLRGIEHMRRARARASVKDLARGPGRLAEALRIDRSLDGIDLLRRGDLWIGSDGARTGAVGESVRIGLTKGAEARLRYYIAGSGFLSGSRTLNR